MAGVSYDKRVFYLKYYENGQRVKGVGFAKTSGRGAAFCLELVVDGLYPTDTFPAEVILESENGEIILGTIHLEKGRGSFCHVCQLSGECGSIRGVRIPLGVSRLVSCHMKLSAPECRAAEQEKPRDIVETSEQEKPRNIVETSEREKPRDIVETSEREKPRDIVETSEREKPRDIVETSELGKRRETPDSLEQAKSREFVENSEREKPREIPDSTEQEEQRERLPTIRLAEEKWEQLWNIYPHLAPFGDEREYLSIGPSDFVLFSAESYQLVNNSFLLHGYYNYRHLLLARVERRDTVVYYVGVPGNYYEREKQVAVMFGFESFECAEEPAVSGDFGYYMMRVRI